MKRRSLLAMTCLTLASVSLCSQAFADKLGDIGKAGVVKVAVLAEYPPFGSVGTDMQAVGLDIDLARIVAEKLAVKAEIVPSTGPNRIPYLQTGKVDLIIACLGKTEERAKVIGYSNAYASTFNAVYGPADLTAKTPSDLVGKTVATVRGSTEDLDFTKIAPEGVIIKRFEDNNGTQSAYRSKQVDFVVTGNVVAVEINKNSPRKLDLKLRVSSEDERAYVGVGKNEPELLKAVNGILADLKADGTLSKLSQKWLGSDIPSDL
ncbi:periplasmic component of amino acid ABC-type transporter/signal transduction system [Rhizobium leguminosarum bv. trifolii WSM597]|uniref:Periplasmic component of amino acid ABC-type transporter/signal transduction system n=1 Tax=Rhizobium leguminosarum bv. trifolii WSM597 TaxID=754764 RepID=J0H9G5_RHILT|nr:transporter substrate-binding domain-containing protein [Rhizobium leguminosarum]EJB07040.1 periplasmic component of amino acid ABC-type transporter/signal transduction system [Rhizobium leguminosarum bv. trifolii WSM597]